LKCDGTRAETRFRLAAKRTSPFKSAGGRQFIRLLAAEVCASAVVMLDTPCSEVVWRVLATHSIRQFPLHFPYPCVTVCHHISTGVYSTHCKVYRGVTREINREIHNRPWQGSGSYAPTLSTQKTVCPKPVRLGSANEVALGEVSLLPLRFRLISIIPPKFTLLPSSITDTTIIQQSSA